VDVEVAKRIAIVEEEDGMCAEELLEKHGGWADFAG